MFCNRYPKWPIRASKIGSQSCPKANWIMTDTDMKIICSQKTTYIRKFFRISKLWIFRSKFLQLYLSKSFHFQRSVEILSARGGYSTVSKISQKLETFSRKVLLLVINRATIDPLRWTNSLESPRPIGNNFKSWKYNNEVCLFHEKHQT